MSDRPPNGIGTCTRCGLCQQACPTYRDWRLEADSPRGRVEIVERIAGGAKPDAVMAEHLYACLGCRACETACPSGVPFGDLLEYGRREVEKAGTLAPERSGWRAFRAFAFDRVLPSRALFSLMMAPARALRRLPTLARAMRSLPLSDGVRRALAMATIDTPAGDARLPSLSRAKGERRARVALFTGCVMEALFGGVNAALVRVLQASGCDVVVPSGQWCCGALNVHAGEERRALEMARRNIEAFEGTEVNAIVVDAAGCGAHMKSYGRLLESDLAFAERAAAFEAKIVDATEYLEKIGVVMTRQPSTRRVTYQDACHLAHGQQIRRAPRALLKALPGVEFVELRDADRCCGAAGLYSLTHPQISQRVLDEKLAKIAETSADTVAVTNPGCQLQLAPALMDRGVRVRHVVELVDEAMQN
jgi:glycolate oxidase iron-sulfur subunit